MTAIALLMPWGRPPRRKTSRVSLTASRNPLLLRRMRSWHRKLNPRMPYSLLRVFGLERIMKSEALLVSCFTRLANAFRASTIPERQMDAIKAMRAITAISAPREKPRRAEIEFSWRRTRLRGEPPEQGPRLLVSRRVLIVKKARAIKGEATDDAELSPELRAVGVVISFRSSISPVKANVMFHELRAGLRSFGGVVASSAAYSSRSQAIGKIRLLRFDHAVSSADF
mmetsp:Transcript_20098/g.47281  ORF Transcript_20098/g.47281 Transcript_20098/m.47281 type:complete len:227 (-) Transcript_20098:307-987(-)